MLPTGTVTFLFTDIEGSTSLWESYPQAMRSALSRHDSILRKEIESYQGSMIKSTGDGMLAVFPYAAAAVEAAVACQHALLAERWPQIGTLRVRMGIHTGEAQERGGDFFGPDVNRAARIMAIAHGGQILLSTVSAELVRERLPDGAKMTDLGLHRLKNIEQPEQIFQLTAPGLPGEFPPLASLAVSNKLPAQVTTFIGRERELIELQRLLGNETNERLVTVVGPGGIGKSRLAIEAGANLAEQFRHGVFFVPLASLSDNQDIVAAIHDSIRIRTTEGDDLRQGLLNYLRNKQLLLIMDNFEHVLAGRNIIVDILQEAPRVKVLSTSRERLNLSGEVLYLLSGLDYPNDSQPVGEEAENFGAVQLLLARTRLVRPGLEVGESDWFHVARICRLVQGMPLGLVLAAGWLEMLTFEEVADEIAGSLDILESQAQDMPERQRSVRAAFEYSWQRLASEDRKVFSQIAVFRGGFSRRAASSVAGAGLRTLRTLLEKSLITAVGADRYAVHELLRQFAEEELEAAGQSGLIRDAHSHYYLEAVASRLADLKGGRQLEALKEIETDLDNVREAWGRALEQGDERAIDQAQESLSLFFFMRARYHEGWALFQNALRQLAVDPSGENDARRLWGRLAARSGILQVQFAAAAPQAEELIKKSLAVAEKDGDKADVAYAYLALGYYYLRMRIDPQLARDSFLNSLERYQALKDHYFVAHALHRVGYCYGDSELSTRYVRQSLELAQRIGDVLDETTAQVNLGWGSLGDGDYAGAERDARDAIALCRETGVRQCLAHSLILLGLCHVLHGRLDEAQAAASEGFAVAEDIPYPLTEAYGLAILSLRASLDGDYAFGNHLASRSLDRHTNWWGDILRHWARATALAGLDQTEQAWSHARAALALQMMYGWEVNVYTIWMMPVVGIIRAQQRQPKSAVEILSIYFNHPLKPRGLAEGWSLLSEWQDRLQKNLGEERYRTAWERGAILDPVSVVEALLAEREETS